MFTLVAVSTKNASFLLYSKAQGSTKAHIPVVLVKIKHTENPSEMTMSDR